MLLNSHIARSSQYGDPRFYTCIKFDNNRQNVSSVNQQSIHNMGTALDYRYRTFYILIRDLKRLNNLSPMCSAHIYINRGTHMHTCGHDMFEY